MASGSGIFAGNHHFVFGVDKAYHTIGQACSGQAVVERTCAVLVIDARHYFLACFVYKAIEPFVALFDGHRAVAFQKSSFFYVFGGNGYLPFCIEKAYFAIFTKDNHSFRDVALFFKSFVAKAFPFGIDKHKECFIALFYKSDSIFKIACSFILCSNHQLAFFVDITVIPESLAAFCHIFFYQCQAIAKRIDRLGTYFQGLLAFGVDVIVPLFPAVVLGKSWGSPKHQKD